MKPVDLVKQVKKPDMCKYCKFHKGRFLYICTHPDFPFVNYPDGFENYCTEEDFRNCPLGTKKYKDWQEIIWEEDDGEI